MQVQNFGSARDVMIRLPAQKGVSSAQQSDKLMVALKAQNAEATLRRTEFVGPQVGEELAADGLKALAFVVIGIMLYLAVRFEWKFSVAAIIANLHDVIIILGFFAFFQWEFSLAVLAAVMASIRFTRFGLQMRAVVQNRRIAATMGIRTGRVDAATFAVGSGIAGIAGVALSQIDNVSPNLGTGYIIDSFMVVVFGGVGSLLGTLVGAMTLGLTNKLLEPYAGAVLAKVAVLVGIMIFIQRRPKGLFALKGRAAE